jgi:recombinational DNA repair protein (RecF pathway)
MKTCTKCGNSSPLEAMELKMGGLLCPTCRRILVLPEEPEYRVELYRRREMAK